MDESLFWVLIAVIYFVLQLLGARKKAPQPRTPQPMETDGGDGTSSPEVTMDDALRELREALGFPTAEPKPRPTPETVRQPSPTPPKRETRRPAQPLPSVDAPLPDLPMPALKKALLKAPARRRRTTTALARRLRDPDAARDAVILTEVLGPPRAKRPPGPHRH